MDRLALSSRDISWSSIPTDLLLAELSKRADGETKKPECGSGERGAYDTALHIGALILILVLSTAACSFPLFSRRRSGAQRRPGKIIFLCQHFGTGVLIATAFVHLLPTAFNSLTDPCLPDVFNKGYTAFAGLVAMVFALSVVALESYLATRGAGHTHSHELWDDEYTDYDHHESAVAHAGLSSRRGLTRRPSNIAMEDIAASEGLMAGVSPLPESTPTIQANGKPLKQDARQDADAQSDEEEEEDEDEGSDLDIDLSELDPAPINEPPRKRQPLPSPAGVFKSGPVEPVAPHIPNAEEQKRLLLQCLLLEAGILFHSVFIGMAISVATGSSFVVFLVAISFHQSFEGLALGSRIAAIHFPRSSPKPWLMVLAFGLTTPFGQFIGLIIHNLYDPMSQTGLLMVGFMNAISSGLLLFAGLVQLLAEDFLSEKSYRTLQGRRRLQAFLAVVAGAVLMAAVGAIA